ncbi:MAG: SOS response-associated peptidase [Calditrichaeota bacterium]|nr:SOS response-associated peptidase [Calditrichota bacterium]MCB9368341.1 SOS response-associated peptidase [Calditrichota bacterium]
MCNAYGTIGYSRSAFLHDLLGIPRNLDYDRPKKVVRPTDSVPVVRLADAGFEQLEMRWGLVPAWSKTMPERPLTNARSETVDELKSFAEAFRSRRCVMPGDEFYEWIKGTKQRVTFRPKEEEFLFAGLWDRWNDGEKVIESCVMLTTSANDVVAPVHDRMPVVLKPEDCVKWLNSETAVEDLKKLLAPLENELITLVEEITPKSNQTSLF